MSGPVGLAVPPASEAIVAEARRDDGHAPGATLEQASSG
jgi:hypothetical protein